MNRVIKCNHPSLPHYEFKRNSIFYRTPHPQHGQMLREWRKTAILDREIFLNYQKECGTSKDFEGAKFFKECAAREMKRQRACTLFIPLFGEPDAKQVMPDPSNWPIELIEQLDEIAQRLYFL